MGYIATPQTTSHFLPNSGQFFKAMHENKKDYIIDRK